MRRGRARSLRVVLDSFGTWGTGVPSSLERGSSAAHFLKPSNEFDYAFWGGHGRKIAGVPHWGG